MEGQKEGAEPDQEDVQVAAGAVIYSPERGAYLLLKHRDGHWEFPKGKREGDEDLAVVMRREVSEETGISVDDIRDFSHVVSYSFVRRGRKVEKRVAYFLVVSDEAARISSEHRGYRWEPYSRALRLLRFPEHREVLQAAHAALQEEGVI